MQVMSIFIEKVAIKQEKIYKLSDRGERNVFQFFKTCCPALIE